MDGRLAKPETGFETTLGVKIRTDKRTTSVTGAIFGDRAGRVILVDGFKVDFSPEGSVIVLKNRDVPGVIGRVGTAIGEAKINIGSYHVARKESEALAVIAVDQPPDARLLKNLEGLPDILEVRLANLTA